MEGGPTRPTQQHDVTEFLAHILPSDAPAIAGSWQARERPSADSPIQDMGGTSPFLSIPVQGFSSVQSGGQQSFRHFLYSAAHILILHLCRFHFQGHGGRASLAAFDRLNPLSIRLHDDGVCSVIGNSTYLKLLLHNGYVLLYTRADS